MTTDKPKILIIGGNGKFGSWFVRYFKEKEIPVKIAGRKTRDTLLSDVAQSDIVIVSVPISKTVEVIQTIRDHVRSDALLCDFTSIKTQSMEEMLQAKSGCGVTGIHPMFGPLVSTLPGQSIVFCSGRDNAWTTYLRDMFQLDDAQIIDSTPEDHDEKMAIVQALTHTVNVLFGAVLKDYNTDQINQFSSPVFRLQSILSARVLGGKPDLYANIAMENPLFKDVLDTLSNTFAKYEKAIQKKDYDAYEKMYTEASDIFKKMVPLAQSKSQELMSMVDSQRISIQPEKLEVKTSSKNIVYALGPKGTFSYQAAKNVFADTDLKLCKTITGVFESVINGPAGTLGLIPIENSTQGVVQESLDALSKFPVISIGSYKMPIHLAVLGNTKNIKDIKVIRSHPQPLAQAKNWFRNNMPDVTLESTSSSVKAILETKDPSVGFVTGEPAADTYNLEILARNIEDKKNNETEFYVISKEENSDLSKQLGASRTAMTVVAHDRPAVLRDILDEFADKNLNLTKLHSKKSDMGDHDYFFFLEFEGRVGEDEEVNRAIKQIDKHCHIKRVIGLV